MCKIRILFIALFLIGCIPQTSTEISQTVSQPPASLHTLLTATNAFPLYFTPSPSSLSSEPLLKKTNQLLLSTTPPSSATTPSLLPSLVSGSLWLEITAPQDETVVNSPQIVVEGIASLGAVISIEDEIILVDTDGKFQVTIFLEEGPNLIEILASDELDNQIFTTLIVIYQP
jgi:hypothetical protein